MKKIDNFLRVVLKTFVRLIVFTLACLWESLEAIVYSLCLAYWMLAKQDLKDKDEWWYYNISDKMKRFFLNDILGKLGL